jgi:hypothetical protein
LNGLMMAMMNFILAPWSLPDPSPASSHCKGRANSGIRQDSDEIRPGRRPPATTNA